MKKTFKKLFVSLTLCATMLCSIVGVAFMQLDTAQADAVYETLKDFKITEEAAVRKTSPNGIRFTTNIKDVKSTIESKLSNVTYGTLLLPADFLGEEELTHATDKVVDVKTSKWRDEDKTEYAAVLAGSLTKDLPESYYNRPIAARSYVTGTDAKSNTVTYYTENTARRSIGYVAYMANLAGDTSKLISDIVDKTNVEIAFDPTQQISVYNSNVNGAMLVENKLPQSTDAAAYLTVGGVKVPADVLQKYNGSISYQTISGNAISANGSKLTAESVGVATIKATATFNNTTYTAEKAISTDVYVGQSDYKILISEDAAAAKFTSETEYKPIQDAGADAYDNDFYDAYEKTAAYKLQDILAEATGVELPIVTTVEDGGKYISVGRTELSKNISLTVTKDTASEVRISGENIIILGKTQLGTLYGVQKWLQDTVGYNYYMDNTYSVNEQVEVVATEKTYSPDIEFTVTQHHLKRTGSADDYSMQSYIERIVPLGTTTTEDAAGAAYKGVAHNSTIVVDTVADTTETATAYQGVNHTETIDGGTTTSGKNNLFSNYTETTTTITHSGKKASAYKSNLASDVLVYFDEDGEESSVYASWFATYTNTYTTTTTVETYTKPSFSQGTTTTDSSETTATAECYHIIANPSYSSTATAGSFESQQYIKAELCYTAHGDATQRNAMVETIAQAMFDKMQIYPSFDRIGFSQADHSLWCECSTCKAQGNPSDNLLEFLLDVAESLKGKLNTAGDSRANTFKISTLFYHQTNQSPKNMANYQTKLDSYMKHIEVWFAETGVDHVDPFGYESSTNNWNKTVKGYFDAWANLCNDPDGNGVDDGNGADMLLWEYYQNTMSFYIPYDTIDAIRENYAIFAAAGVDYIFNQMVGAQNNWAYLKQYLMSKLSWNAGEKDSEGNITGPIDPATWEEWIKGFFQGVYGAGWEEMYTYYKEDPTPEENAEDTFISWTDWCNTAKSTDFGTAYEKTYGLNGDGSIYYALNKTVDGYLFRADNNWDIKGPTNASLTFDPRITRYKTSASGYNPTLPTAVKYFTSTELEGWITKIDAAIAALDPSDPKYDIYYKNIMLEKTVPMYLLMWVCDDFVPERNQTNPWLFDYETAGEFTSTTYVEKYGAEYLAWINEWGITEDGEGRSNKFFLESIKAAGQSADSIVKTQYVDKVQYVTNTETTTITNALLTEGSYEIYVGKNYWKDTTSVSNGTATFNATDGTPGDSYTLTFKGATSTVIFANVVVVTDTSKPATGGYYVIDRDYYIEEGKTETWLTHNVLAKGAYTVTINGVGSSATVYAAGKLKVQLNAAATNGTKYTVEVKQGNYTYVFTVYGATYIRTADELAALGVGTLELSNITGKDIKGYYALANDIDCGGKLFTPGHNYGMSNFIGTFDGNGYTISNLIAGDSGIFGGLKNATIKNVNFKKVRIQLNQNAGWNYGALFANAAKNTVFENITAQYAEITDIGDKWDGSSYSQFYTGLFVANGTENSTYRNVEFNVSGASTRVANEIPCIFGANAKSFNCENVRLIVTEAQNANLIYYYVNNKVEAENLGTSTTTPNPVHSPITSCPDGVEVATAVGLFNIMNEETSVCIGSDLDITTNRNDVNYTYTLKKAVTGISISGNKVTVDETATAGATFTVVVAGDNYQTEEITFTVAKAQKSFSDVPTFEQLDGEFTLPNGIDGTVLKIAIGGEVVYDSVNAIGGLDGTTVTFGEKALTKQTSLGKGVEMLVETATTVYTGSANVYTMIIDSVAELDKWQEVAAENAVKAGICIEVQKGYVYSGYFILSDNIEYNKVWTPYKTFGQIWGLYGNNKEIWEDKIIPTYKDGAITNNASGKLIDGAINEDWGSGKNAGFKGVFDGNGYYIDGLETSGQYSGFIVTMGLGGVVKDVAFTNAVVGAQTGLVIQRGNGTLENIYVEVKSIANGASGGGEATTIIGSAAGGTVRTVKNVLVDFSNADISAWKYGYVGYLENTSASGLYVLGADGLELTKSDFGGDATASIFNSYNESHVAGSFADTAALLGDATAAAEVATWSTDFWTVDKDNKLILPTKLYRIRMTEDLEEVITIEQTAGTFTIPDQVQGTVSKVVVGGYTLNNVNAKAVTIGTNDLVAQENLGEGVEIAIHTEGGKIYAGYANVYTMIIDDKAELDQWQAVAAENAVKAGVCVEVQKGYVYTGYFVLNTNIEYNGVWTPYKTFGEIWGLYGSDAWVEAFASKEVKEKSADGKAILYTDGSINEDWGTGYYAGFKGVFDGNGHYINGMETSGDFAGFVVTMGGGTIKDVAFTNASIGANAGFVSNRGPGTIENVYVQVVSMGNGQNSDNPSSVITRHNHPGNVLNNILVDMSSINVATLKYACIANLASDPTNGVYIIGGEGLGEPAQDFSESAAAKTFLHYNDNSENAADYDVAGSFATAADLLADQTHGAVVKAWAESDFWTVDAENGKVIPTVLTTITPPQIVPKTIGGENLNVYDGDATKLGFAKTAVVYQVNITVDNWYDDRIRIQARNENADYISFDFALPEGHGVNSFTVWPCVNGASKGSYAINGAGVSTSNADSRKIFILDQNDKDVTKGPWAANTVYTMRVYTAGESILINGIDVATDWNETNTFYVANAKGVVDGTIPIFDNSQYMLPFYNGDVTALGFEKDTKVQYRTTETITTGEWWGGGTVDSNGKTREQLAAVIPGKTGKYVTIKFAVSEDIASGDVFYVWGLLGSNYIQDGAINFASTTLGRILDMDGNAVTSISKNTVYILELYIEGTDTYKVANTCKTGMELYFATDSITYSDASMAV